jgi:hypothetical protein
MMNLEIKTTGRDNAGMRGMRAAELVNISGRTINHLITRLIAMMPLPYLEAHFQIHHHT